MPLPFRIAGTTAALSGLVLASLVQAVPPAPAKGDVTRAQLVAETRRVFNRADTNHDGYMSRAEFAVRMGAVLNETPPGTPDAPTPAEAQKMLNAANRAFSDVDTNRDGKLSFAEASARPLKAFDMMDTNHDGVLTLAEKAAAHSEAAKSVIGPVQPDPGPTPGR